MEHAPHSKDPDLNSRDRSPLVLRPPSAIQAATLLAPGTKIDDGQLTTREISGGFYRFFPRYTIGRLIDRDPYRVRYSAIETAFFNKGPDFPKIPPRKVLIDFTVGQSFSGSSFREFRKGYLPDMRANVSRPYYTQSFLRILDGGGFVPCTSNDLSHADVVAGHARSGSRALKLHEHLTPKNSRLYQVSFQVPYASFFPRSVLALDGKGEGQSSCIHASCATIFPYFSGTTLRERWERGRNKNSLQVLLRVAKTLASLQPDSDGQPVGHLNLSPEMISLRTDGSVRLGRPGTLIHSEEHDLLLYSTSSYNPFAFHDSRADVMALSIMCYEVITGELPIIPHTVKNPPFDFSVSRLLHAVPLPSTLIGIRESRGMPTLLRNLHAEFFNPLFLSTIDRLWLGVAKIDSFSLADLINCLETLIEQCPAPTSEVRASNKPFARLRSSRKRMKK